MPEVLFPNTHRHCQFSLCCWLSEVKIVHFVGHRLLRKPAADRFGSEYAVMEVLFGRVHRRGQDERLEEGKQRPQRMLDHQGVTLAAAGRGQKHRLAAQRGGLDQVEECLNSPV